ncbi:hypothetical protein [Saccharomonospora halophila]|uniref:hypothetical protein n=1 Tax=Saccharomonospora halophila TaxID=129922 RepID=UPI00048A7F72|nr:hypothetical protein [Saccharomonospora halophila]
MPRHALLDRSGPESPAEITLRLPPMHSADTAVMYRLPDYWSWPVLDPDVESDRARSALRQRTDPPLDVLRRVLDGLRALN